MNSEGAPDRPDQPTEEERKASRVHMEVEYVMPTQQLLVRAGGTPTIFVQGIILEALARVDKMPPPAPAALKDGKVLVVIDYDMIADRILVETNAPRVVSKGVLQHALGAVTRNQIQQMFQVYKQGMEKRVAELEADMAKRKIILAGG